MASRVVELRGKMEKLRSDMAEEFKKYPDLNMPDDVASNIKKWNDELTDVSKDFDEVRALEEIGTKVAQDIEEKNRPTPFQHPGGNRQEARETLKSLGFIVTDDPEFKSHHKDSKPDFSIVIDQYSMTDDLGAAGYKTLMTTTAGFPPEVTRTGRLVEMARQRPTVADLIPQDDTESSAIRYMEETTFTNNAAPVAEGGVKPESALGFTERTIPVEVIATWIPITMQQLEDVRGIRGVVDNRLTLMLRLAEENQLMNGNGTSPQLIGFLNKPGIQTQAKGTDPTPDAIYKAFTKIRYTGFAEPSGGVMHPNDWQDIALLRTADGMYIWGHPADAMGPERIWGVPIVVTTAMTEGTALFGDFVLYSHISRRMGIRIDVSDSHSDFFVRNQLAIRIEERLALEIYRAAAFATVTGI